jgi:hypothetical protein
LPLVVPRLLAMVIVSVSLFSIELISPSRFTPHTGLGALAPRQFESLSSLQYRRSASQERHKARAITRRAAPRTQACGGPYGFH